MPLELGCVRAVDVVVFGSGPAGATAALCLARAGTDVLLVERPRHQLITIGEGLPPTVHPMLATLGLWDQFQAAGHLPSYGNRSAWGSPALAERDFLFNPYGHGWHLDRAAFDRMLVTAARHAGAHHAITPAARWHPAGADQGDGVVEIRPDAGPIALHAQAVLDCTGRAAHVAQRLGARRIHHDKLVAVATVHTAADVGDNDSSTLVEAVQDGWWYTALLPDHRRIFVYLTDGDLVHTATVHDLDQWLARLRRTEHMRRRYEEFGYHPATGPMVLPAGSSTLQPAGDARRRWLAAGDAAISVDPLSSQGILTAIMHGRLAAASILEVLDGQLDAADTYQAAVDRVGRDYLQQRSAYYRCELRWPESTFWQRRRSARRAIDANAAAMFRRRGSPAQWHSKRDALPSSIATRQDAAALRTVAAEG